MFDNYWRIYHCTDSKFIYQWLDHIASISYKGLSFTVHRKKVFLSFSVCLVYTLILSGSIAAVIVIFPCSYSLTLKTSFKICAYECSSNLILNYLLLSSTAYCTVDWQTGDKCYASAKQIKQHKNKFENKRKVVH